MKKSTDQKNTWVSYRKEQLDELNTLCNRYKEYISACKTERECVSRAIELAREKGYRSLDECVKDNKKLKAGDKVYADCFGKSLFLASIGEKPIEEGMNILGAHVDSPRIDLKQKPVYEDTDFALLDTHYYGGIKKYQWVAMPLAMHGIVAKKDGSVVRIVEGEKSSDPVFYITDLLPHLDTQKDKKIKGEDLDILAGSRPLKTGTKKDGDKDEEKDCVKKMLLSILKKKYNIEEDDFLSAEIEMVPAGPARDCGFDKSMVVGYGQDDRVCAYTSLAALLDMSGLQKTAVCLLADKEEIGSVGATGMSGRFFENSTAEVMHLTGDYSELKLRRALARSNMLSSDVSAAYDPLYASAYEKRNAAYFGRGVGFNKFTGSGGKFGSNDASAEYIAKIRAIFEKEGVAMQLNEMGKVDVGGGGTIAYLLAEYGMNVIDCGTPVLSMHAPYEVCSKSDIYETYLGYKAFLKHA